MENRNIKLYTLSTGDYGQDVFLNGPYGSQRDCIRKALCEQVGIGLSHTQASYYNYMTLKEIVSGKEDFKYLKAFMVDGHDGDSCVIEDIYIDLNTGKEVRYQEVEGFEEFTPELFDEVLEELKQEIKDKYIIKSDALAEAKMEPYHKIARKEAGDYDKYNKEWVEEYKRLYLIEKGKELVWRID